jgi:hypothetical protein
MNRAARTALALTTGLAVAAVWPSAAMAAPPERPDRITFEADIPGAVDCGDFALDVHLVVWAQETVTDQASRLHVSYTFTWTNPETGESVSAKGVGNSMYHVDADRRQVSGNDRVVTVPGVGVVLLSAGHVVEAASTGERLFTAGPGTNDETLLCQHLA